MKRIISLLLVLGLCMGLLCLPVTAETSFTDVAPGAYYYDPVVWAVDENITTGTTATTFSPDATCTRNQVVTFLWRAMGSPEPSGGSNPFVDVKASDYFYKAVLWAVEKGITNGVDETHFGPENSCTRAQVATFLWRTLGSKAPASTKHPFTDIDSKQYYYNAVLWAVENNVTNGMTATTFAPDATCTRGQIVTFLYRALHDSHSHSYTAKVTAPTCTEKGYTTNTCACGDKYIDDEVAALGHSHTAVVTAPTCTENGYTTYTCSCGDSYTQPGAPLLGHSWNAGVVDKAPTQTEEGILLYTCGTCGATKTEPIAKTVSISLQPADGEVMEYQEHTFTVEAVNGQQPYTYRWQYKHAFMTDYADVPEDDYYTDGADTASLKVTGYSPYMEAGYRYRCVITDGRGDSVISNDVTLKEKYYALEFTTNLQDLECPVNSIQSLLVAVMGGKPPYSYTWQYKDKTMPDFADMGYPDSDLISIEVSQQMIQDEYTVRVVVTDSVGASVNSNTAVMKHMPPLTVLTQPHNCRTEVGEEAEFTLEATGGQKPYSYRWYFIDNSMSDWMVIPNAEGGNQQTLSVEMTDFERSGNIRYRCIVIDSQGWTVTSNEVRPIFPLAIIKQPKNDYTANLGDEAEFSLKVVYGNGAPSFQWQYAESRSKAEAGEWEDIENEIGNFLNVTVTDMNHVYRCKITDLDGSVYSDTVEAGQLRIVVQPEDYTVKTIGKEGSFSVELMGGEKPFTYTWYYSPDGGVTYHIADGSNGHTDADTGCIKFQTSSQGAASNWVYFCEITDNSGERTSTKIVSVNYPLTIVTQPQPQTAAPGNKNTQFQVTVGGGEGPYTYCWYYRDGSSNWFEASLSGLFTGCETNTLKINEVYSNMYNYEFRCVIGDSNGRIVYSDIVKVLSP